MNGNDCPHQAVVALKFGTNNLNFIPQTAKDRFNLATLAVGNNTNLNVPQFVGLHQKEIESNAHFYGDDEMEDDKETLPTMTDSSGSPEMYKHVDNIKSVTNETEHLPHNDISMEQIIQLHIQVSQDIEYKIRTSDKNFRQCYFKYLSLYRKIIAKCRGQAPVAALASAYAHLGKDRDRNYLPILHNRARIKVQPTAISLRKSGIKSSTAQPSGHHPKLSNKENGTRVRKVFNN